MKFRVGCHPHRCNSQYYGVSNAPSGSKDKQIVLVTELSLVVPHTTTIFIHRHVTTKKSTSMHNCTLYSRSFKNHFLRFNTYI